MMMIDDDDDWWWLMIMIDDDDDDDDDDWLYLIGEICLYQLTPVGLVPISPLFS